MESIKPAETALVLIDLQAGILRLPVAPHSSADVLARAGRLAAGFRSAGATVVLVRVAWSANFKDAPPQDVDLSHSFEIGDDWADLAPGLGQAPDDVIITKRQWGAFNGTELDLQLRRRGVRTIVLAGIATNMGVESTARAAWEHNYSVIVAEDAVSGLSAEMHQFAISSIFPLIGRVRSTQEILETL